MIANPTSKFQGRTTMLLRTIETFLRAHAMPATKFGRLAAHDPRFVLDLRMGRIPRPDTELRTRAWMQGYADGSAVQVKEAA
jgi:hypothetical protein